MQELENNFPKQFEVGDFVAGPRAKVGMHAIGYVSKVISTEPDAEDETYSTQTLTITGVDAYDAIAFRTLSSGAKLQKIAYAQKTFVTPGSKPLPRSPIMFASLNALSLAHCSLYSNLAVSGCS